MVDLFQDGVALPIVVSPVDDVVEAPLSAGQRALWFMQRLNPTSAAYHVARAVVLPRELDVDALRRAMDALVQRHPALRTSFRLRNGEPVQRVLPRPSHRFETVDASAWPEAELHAWLEREVTRPFDLERETLFRCSFVRTQTGEHIGLVVFHHTVIDLWSLAVFLFELNLLYRAECTGEPAKLPAPTSTYADHATEQAALLAGPEGERLWAFWRDELAGDFPPLDLPGDRPRPPVHGDRCGCVARRLGVERTNRLRAMVRQRGVLLHDILLAAYQALLFRHSGQSRFLVGIPHAGRNRRFMGTVGYFVNPLPIRAELDDAPPFAELVQRVATRVRAAAAHGEYPFVRIAEQLQTRRDPSRPPLFQVAFAWQKTVRLVDRGAFGPFILHQRGGAIPFGDLFAESYPLEPQVSTVDLTLLGAELDDEVALSLEFSHDLFDRDTVERMMDHLLVLLDAALADPACPIDALPLLDPAEREAIVAGRNRTDAPAGGRTLHEMVSAQAERTPHALALVGDREQLTYAELEARANRLAHLLRARGVGAESRVAVCLSRPDDAVVALLATLKAGGAYVPMDPGYPEERLRSMLEDAAPAVVLGGAKGEERGASDPLPAHVGQHPAFLALDELEDELAACPATPPEGEVAPEGLAYVIFTSGSTGRPKGVMVEHRSVVNLVRNQIREFGLGPGRRQLQFASLSFDASVSEVFTALASGAELHLSTRERMRDPRALEELLRDRRITTVTLPPSLLAHLAPDRLPELETLVSAGEALPLTTARRWAEGRRLLNAYGPTEATVGPTLHRFGSGATAESSTVPIGRPLANVRCYVLDAHGEPVPDGVAGELYIGGVQVARGYLNRPELSAERFVASPFVAGDRLYRTGDRVRWLRDGTLEFLGRIDEQMKLRGFRIEPGEIESVLRDHAAVQAAVVTVRTDGPAPRLVGYVIPRPGADPAPQALREHLRERLPDFMIPAAWVTLDRLPLSPNGKVDRGALPAPSIARIEALGAEAQPRNQVERTIAEVWADALQVDRVGLHDNFFDLGGHSLLAVHVHEQLRARLGRDFEMIEIFRHPTVRALAEALSGADDGESALQEARGRAELQKAALQRQQLRVQVAMQQRRRPRSGE